MVWDYRQEKQEKQGCEWSRHQGSKLDESKIASRFDRLRLKLIRREAPAGSKPTTFTASTADQKSCCGRVILVAPCGGLEHHELASYCNKIIKMLSVLQGTLPSLE
jgi:hypothetical protein